MGQKTDRIKHLETSLAASNTLIRFIGERLHVEVDDDVTPDNLARYLSRFAAAAAAATDVEEDDDHALPGGSLQTFDKLVDQETDRMRESGLLGDGGSPVAMVPSARRSTAFSEGERVGVATVLDIARELHIDVSDVDLPAALVLIYKEILRIKNPGDVGGESADSAGLTKGDSLAQAIQYGRETEHHLRDELRSSRELVARVAAAMQLPAWNPHSGEEILERIQRWESIKHLLRRRILQLDAGEAGSGFGAALACDLRAVLVHIVGPAVLAKFLENKPKAVISATVLATAERSAAAPEAAASPFKSLTPADLDLIAEAVHTSSLGGKMIAAEPVAHLVPVLTAISSAPRSVRVDLVTFMNLVTLPALEKA